MVRRDRWRSALVPAVRRGQQHTARMPRGTHGQQRLDPTRCRPWCYRRCPDPARRCVGHPLTPTSPPPSSLNELHISSPSPQHTAYLQPPLPPSYPLPQITYHRISSAASLPSSSMRHPSLAPSPAASRADDAANPKVLHLPPRISTPVQRPAVSISLEGRDLMACAQSGSGKTTPSCFPVIRRHHEGTARGEAGAVRQRSHGYAHVYPSGPILPSTKELSMQWQIHEVLRKFSFQIGIKVVVAYGGAPITQRV